MWKNVRQIVIIGIMSKEQNKDYKKILTFYGNQIVIIFLVVFKIVSQPKYH